MSHRGRDVYDIESVYHRYRARRARPDALRSARRALDEGGRLVFSVEHPVMTSCDRARAGDEPRGDWIVDGYFEEAGARREGRPMRERFEDPGEYARRSRIPLFLILSARRHSAPGPERP